MDTNREAAYKILLDLDKEDVYLNIAMGKVIGSLKADNPAFVRRLVYGTCEKRIYLDYHLDKLLTKGIKKTDEKTLNILRMALYQLEFMDSVPDYAAISTSVDLAKKYAKGRDGFVNGVLRNWKRKKAEIELPSMEEDIEGFLSVKYSYHPGIVRHLIDEVGAKRAELIMEAQTREPSLALRVNLALSNMDDVSKELETEGIGVERDGLSSRILKVLKSPENITDTMAYREGRISIQSPESCMIADHVEASKGMRVLDLCAAPGGKTMAMAEAMKNDGEIIACDIHDHRCRLIEENAKRCKIDIIETLCIDGTKVREDMELGNSTLGLFDRVLIDAPCSGLGVISKKPDIKLKAPRVKPLIEIQRGLIEAGSKLVKPGGKLIYSTCTISQRENQDIVKGFLDSSEEKPETWSLEYEKQLYPDIDGRDGFYVATITRNKV